MGGEKVEPLVNVVAFEEAVGAELAAAGAVGAGVWEEDGESVDEEELSVSGCAEAIVGEAVQEDDGIAVGVVRSDCPGTERDGVWSGDGNVFQVGVEMESNVAHRGFIF